MRKKSMFRSITISAAGRAAAIVLCFTLLGAGSTALSATYIVNVIGNEQSFSPDVITIRVGDTVEWHWISTPDHCSVTSGTPQTGPNGVFDSGIHRPPHTFSYTFTTIGHYDYYCTQDPEGIMVGSVDVIGSQPLNISTRLRVQTGENVLIGGFIISGNVRKNVIIRAIGPSLQQSGVTDALADPIMELHGSDGSFISSNDNWKDTQQAEIENTGIPPQNDLESAIVANLAPGSYTTIVSGVNAATGIGLVEVYDLDQPSSCRLANISTRGFVQTESNVMIGGFILDNSIQAPTVVVRAIGPSLTQFGINNALPDPTLDLRDANGSLVRNNNNWRESQQTEIEATGLAPSHDLESALVAELPPAPYTVIVSGAGSTTGVGVVEVYDLQ